MKIRSFAETFVLILITLILVCSCSTTANSEVFSTSIVLAEKQIQNGMFEDALETYTRAYDKVNDYRLLYNKIEVLVLLERYDEAIQLCNDGFAKYPYVIKFLNAKIYCLNKLERYSEAEKEYLRILSLSPYDSSAIDGLIQLYSDTGASEQAYMLALEIWNKGIKTKTVITALHDYDPGQWEEVYKLFK